MTTYANSRSFETRLNAALEDYVESTSDLASYLETAFVPQYDAVSRKAFAELLGEDPKRPRQNPCTVKFKLRPDGSLRINFTIDTLDWLCSGFDPDKELQRLFSEFSELPENKGKPALELMCRFPSWLVQNGHEVSGPGDEPRLWANTLREPRLAETVAFCAFKLDGEDCAILLLHKGLDSEDTRLIAVRSPCITEALKPRRVIIQPNPAERGDWCERWQRGEVEQLWWRWEALNGSFTWKCVCDNGGLTLKRESQSRDYRNLNDYPAKEIRDRSEWEPGIVGILPDGTGLCPLSGATLQGSYCME